MLTESQYVALCKIRDGFVPATGKPDDVTIDLCERRFIKIKKSEYVKEDECMVFYMKTFWVLTPLGRDALQAYEDQIAAKNEEAKQKHIDRILATVAVIIALLTLAVTIIEKVGLPN